MARQRGSVNRTTKETKEIINKMLNECLTTLKDDLKLLKPIERINTILSIMPYLIPKLRSHEQKIDFNKLEPNEIKQAINQLLDE